MSDEDGMSEWINTLDQIVGFPDDFYTVQLTKLGIKNQQKLTNPATGEVNEPPLKLCRKGRHWMNWRVNGAITKQKSGNYTYRSVCNGVCLKVHHSVPVKMKVSIGERCHNPRCSGVDPTFIWDENQKLYCGKICIDGYQKWHDAQGIMVSDLLHHFSSHFDPQIGSMVGDYGTPLLRTITNLLGKTSSRDQH